MTPLLLALFACDDGGDIPRDPGTFTDDASMRRAWLAASPDNLMLQLVLRHTDTNFVGDCPTTEENELELTFTGGCDGDNGETWHGEGIVRQDEDHMQFVEYGLSWGGTTWLLTGEMDWSFPDPLVPDEEVRIDTRLDWSSGTQSYEATADLEYLLDWNSGRPRFTWIEGEIGVEDWGTADVTSGVVDLGTSIGCTWPGSGALDLVGANDARFAFGGCEVCPKGYVDEEEVDNLCLEGSLPKLVTPLYEPDDTGL